MIPSPVPSIHARVTAQLRAAGCVFAEEEADLLLGEAKDEAELVRMVEQRAGGLPVERVVGWAEFDGLRIAVGPGVFVPRHRTEFLVQEAARLTRPGAVVVDLCCGSGALGVALAARVGKIQLQAADIDPAEVECARRNVAAAGGRVYEGDLFEALPRALRGCINTLLANVPYVPTKAIEFLPTEARLYEPVVALNGGDDGLEILRRVAAEAADWLAPGGYLLTEASEQQAKAAEEVLAANGLKTKVATSDELDATVIIGRRPKLGDEGMKTEGVNLPPAGRGRGHDAGVCGGGGWGADWDYSVGALRKAGFEPGAEITGEYGTPERVMLRRF